MLLCLLALTAEAATPTRTTVAKPQLLPTEAWDRIRTGRVHVERGDLAVELLAPDGDLFVQIEREDDERLFFRWFGLFFFCQDGSA